MTAVATATLSGTSLVVSFTRENSFF